MSQINYTLLLAPPTHLHHSPGTYHDQPQDIIFAQSCKHRVTLYITKNSDIAVLPIIPALCTRLLKTEWNAARLNCSAVMPPKDPEMLLSISHSQGAHSHI